MKPLYLNLLFILLAFQLAPCIASDNEFKLISKNYNLITINNPKEINSKGLFFPPNVIQFDEKNNLSYHLIDTNKIAIKEGINGSLLDIIEVPIKKSKYDSPREFRPTITSITLDSKRNELWISTFQDFNYVFDLDKKKYRKLIIKGIGDMYGMEAGFYDSDSDSTFIVNMGEVGPELLNISNNNLSTNHIPSHKLNGFKGVDEIYSIVKSGSDLLVWEGAYNAENIWVIETKDTHNKKYNNPINFKEPKNLTNKVDSRFWWGLLPRTPYSKGDFKGIAKLSVDNTVFCKKFKDEVAENYISSKHLFDIYRQNLFGLNKFDYKKLKKSTTGHYSFEKEIDGKLYYISPRTISGCGSRCETQFTAVTPKPIGTTWDYLKANPEQPKPVPHNQHSLATDDNGQLYYVSFNALQYKLHTLNEGKWELSCLVNINPTESLSSSDGKADDLKDALQENLKTLSLSVQNMIAKSGEGRSCKGSYRVNYVRKKNFNRLFDLVSSRPHQFTSIKNYPEVFLALKNWSYGGLHQHQIFKDYQKSFNDSQDQLSQFYQLQFNLKSNEANTKAEYALKTAVSAGINYFENKSLNYTLGLRKAILDKHPIEKIKSEITQSAHAELDSILNLAVTYPEALKILIKEGFDVNQKNPFGKTPLMYAAQHNQFESIAVLLAAQADPNLMTHQPKDNECNYLLKTTNLSSLHYAVRFSDFKSIKLIIDSGAWKELKSIEHNKYKSTALDWLTKHRNENKNLSQDDFDKLKILLSPKKGKELRRFTKKLTIKAEEDYHSGKLDFAYQTLTLIISSDPEYIRALSDLALVSLKIKDFETALDINKRILRLSKKDNERASAYFNIGLTCERIPEISNVDYYKREICRKGLLPIFLESLLLKETKSRKNKVSELVRESKTSCTIKDDESNLITLHIDSDSSRLSNFIVSYTKKSDSEITPLNLNKQLNLQKTIIRNKKETNILRKEHYQGDDMYIEKITLASQINSSKIKALCH